MRNAIDIREKYSSIETVGFFEIKMLPIKTIKKRIIAAIAGQRTFPTPCDAKYKHSPPAKNM